MPRAHGAYAAGGDDRVPRTLFIHAHEDAANDFPADCGLGEGRMITQLPDNWNGTDAIIIWYLPSEAWVNEPFNIILNAGKDTEAFNLHTQTLANRLISGGANVYHAEDITGSVAAFIALITSGDIIWILSTDVNGIAGKTIGLEIQET